MGFLDWIFGKKGDEKEIEEAKMSLGDVSNLLAEKLEKDFGSLRESTEKECMKEYNNLQTAAKTLQEKLKALEQAPYSGKKNPMLITKAVGSRKSFIKKMELLIKQIKNPLNNDIESITDFHNETARQINTTNAKTVKEFAFLKELFPMEGQEVLENFRQIMEIDTRLGNLIKEFKKSIGPLMDAQETVTEISKLTEEIKGKGELSELEKNLGELKRRYQEMENEMKSLLASTEWEAFMEMQKARENLETELQNKKSDFVQHITEVEKPLKKYKWSVENEILDDYAEKSFESVLSKDPKGDVFLSAIKNMKERIANGEMDVKDKDRFSAAMDRMIADNTMGKIFEGYSKISEELKNYEKRIISHGAPRKKKELETEIGRLNEEIEKLKMSVTKAEERTRMKEEEKVQKLKELENALRDVAGKQITIVGN